MGVLCITGMLSTPKAYVGGFPSHGSVQGAESFPSCGAGEAAWSLDVHLKGQGVPIPSAPNQYGSFAPATISDGGCSLPYSLPPRSEWMLVLRLP